jgi:hypothetical protein
MILEKILSLFDFENYFRVSTSFQEGSVILNHGEHSLEVVTRKAPTDVWLSLKDAEGFPVCHGNINKVSYTINDRGFVLYVDVSTDMVRINWFAEFLTGK